MGQFLYPVIVGIVILIVLGFVQYNLIQKASKNKVASLEQEAEIRLENANKEAEAVKKEAILEAKEEVHRLRADFDRESRERRNEIQRLERRLIQREESLDKKVNYLRKRKIISLKNSRNRTARR